MFLVFSRGENAQEAAREYLVGRTRGNSMPEGEKRISGAWSRTSEDAPRKNIWEGKILKKISKKIVALATMAAFVLTLVPAAAFAAAGDGEPDAQASEFVIVDNGSTTTEVTVDTNETVTLQFNVNDKTGVGSNTDLGKDSAVKVWAEKAGEATSAASFKAVTSGAPAVQKSNAANVYKLVGSGVTNGDQYAVEFSRPGTYTIHAGVGDIAKDGNMKDVVELNDELGDVTVNVEGTSVATSVVQFGGDDLVAGQPTNFADGDSVNFEPSLITNGIDSAKIWGTAYAENDNYAANETFDLATNAPGIVDVPATVTTNNKGAFSFDYKVSKAGNYKIYMSNDDMELTLNIKASATDLDGITTTENNAQTLLAGSDKNYSKGNAWTSFADAVQFEITDKYGDVVENADLTNEPAANQGDSKHANYLSVTVPAKSDLKANELKLVWDKTAKAYTLEYVGGNAKKDLIPGEYTVNVGLKSGKTATATFTLENYGTTKDLAVKAYAKKTGAAATEYVVIGDKIALGQDLKLAAKYVDENGIEINATDTKYGADGKAVVEDYSKTLGASYAGQYKISTDDSLIGTTIYAKAFDEKAKKYVETELTVVDSYNTYTLAFDQEKGAANTSNNVEVSVVDEDGDVATNVSGEVLAYVADQDDDSARIEVGADERATKGKATITLFSDKETTADIVVAVKADNGAMYGKTLKYTFGKADVNADTTVVMTVGSSDYVVNNDVVTGDAAPYIDSAWRTMVPFRVLGETFGAEVEWNQDKQTVTYTYGDNELVMTIGEKTYTVNGEEKTMDTAPVIQKDRTFVPVRFVAEALGYTVTPLYDSATGTTASVVFQK